MAVCQDIAAVSLRCARRADPFQKRRVEAKKLADSLLTRPEKLLLTNFIPSVIKSGARVALGVREDGCECRCGSRITLSGMLVSLT